MSTLTGQAIFAAIGNGKIKTEPFDPKLVNPHSVDLHLGASLKQYSRKAEYRVRKRWSDLVNVIDSRNPPPLVDVPLEDINARDPAYRAGSKPPLFGWILVPGTLYLGTTLEYTETRGYRPVLDGRSSTGRLGAFMHITAGYGDNGFKGHWTLEIAVVEPLILYPGQRLLQISYETLEGIESLYGETGNSSGTYQGQVAEPIASKSSLDG